MRICRKRNSRKSPRAISRSTHIRGTIATPLFHLDKALDALDRRQLDVHPQRNLMLREHLNHALAVGRFHDVRDKGLVAKLRDIHFSPLRQPVARPHHQHQRIAKEFHCRQLALLRAYRKSHPDPAGGSAVRAARRAKTRDAPECESPDEAAGSGRAPAAGRESSFRSRRSKLGRARAPATPSCLCGFLRADSAFAPRIRAAACRRPSAFALPTRAQTAAGPPSPRAFASRC